MAQPSDIALTTIAETGDIPPAIAAAILVQVAVRLDRWMSARSPAHLIVPRMEDLTLERGGRVWWRRGRSIPASNAVAALGALLESLLARAPQRQTPPGLVYVISRATDPRHLAPIGSIREFATAVARHAPRRPMGAIDALIARHLASARAVPALDGDSTIADVRRRRRAGGTSLTTIAEDTHIPVSLLRELEWGVYDNWRLPQAAAVVAAYAERAGLDPGDVIAIIAREQRQTALVPVRGVPLALVARVKELEGSHRALPFALAAALFAALALATPSERSAPQTAAVRADVRLTPVSAGPPVREQAPADRKLVPLSPANDQRNTHGPVLRTPSRKLTRAPRRAAPPPSDAISATRANVAPDVESADQADSGPRRALVRLANAIAGDGRHRVEPFPRPAPEEPPD
jgi:hypothetical protein